MVVRLQHNYRTLILAEVITDYSIFDSFILDCCIDLFLIGML